MLFNLDVEKRKIECDLLNHLYVIRRYCTAHHAQNQHAKEGAVMNSNRAAELPSFIDDDLLHSIYCVMEHSYHEAARVLVFAICFNNCSNFSSLPYILNPVRKLLKKWSSAALLFLCKYFINLKQDVTYHHVLK